MFKINKFYYLLIVFCAVFLNFNVYAKDYAIDDLILVSEEATVITDTFTYNGIKFENDVNNVVNGKVRFQSITNNTNDKIAPSIGILLFDSDMKNIGYITYCASKDYDSDNSHITISGNGSIPFEFIVSPKYFGANEKDKDEIIADSSAIAYYAVHDDNKYCQIGGYTKYLGFTIDEITGGGVYTRDLKMSDLILYLPYLLIALVALIGYGLLLNTVYKRMHARTSILSYIPLTNLYIAVKLAFGKKVAWLFYMLCIISFFVAYNSSSLTFTWVLLIFVGVSTLIDLIKLLTGKYDMFIIGKKHKKSEDSLDDVYESHSGSRFIEESENKNQDVDDTVSINSFINSINNDSSLVTNNEMNSVNSGDVVDISYESDTPITEDFTAINSDNTESVNSFPVVNNLGDNNSFTGTISSNVLVPVSNVASETTLEDDSSNLSNIYNSDNNVNNNIDNNNNNISNNSVPKLGNEEISGESELSNFFK